MFPSEDRGEEVGLGMQTWIKLQFPGSSSLKQHNWDDAKG